MIWNTMFVMAAANPAIIRQPSQNIFQNFEPNARLLSRGITNETTITTVVQIDSAKKELRVVSKLQAPCTVKGGFLGGAVLSNLEGMVAGGGGGVRGGVVNQVSRQERKQNLNCACLCRTCFHPNPKHVAEQHHFR